MSIAAQLQDGLAAMGLDLPSATQAKLIAYIKLLKKWNGTYNLTAIRDESEMLTHHLLDSLSVLTVLQASALAGPRSGYPIPPSDANQCPARRWADVGSGAGLPGIPLAIVRGDLDMTLIETVEKKAAFQRQAKIELDLPNITIASSRVEDMPAAAVEAAISRAFADLSDFARLAGHLLSPGGRLYAMKGRIPEDEIKRLSPAWRTLECHRLHVPGMDAQRHLLVLEKV